MQKQINNRKQPWLGIFLPAILCLLWIFIFRGEPQTGGALPSPRTMGMMLYDFAFGGLDMTTYSGEMLEHLGASGLRVLKGFLLSSVLGMSMGFITGKSATFYQLVDPMLQAIRAIPGIGFLPIAIVWFGVGEKNTLFLITMAAFFPVYLNTYEAIVRVPRDYIRSGQMLGAKGMTLFTKVIFPAAFPQIFVGLRLSLGISWAYLVLGEMTGVAVGIGAVMMNGRMLGNVALVITGMIVIAIAGKLSDWLLILLYRVFYEKGGVRRHGK